MPVPDAALGDTGLYTERRAQERTDPVQRAERDGNGETDVSGSGPKPPRCDSGSGLL